MTDTPPPPQPKAWQRAAVLAAFVALLFVIYLAIPRPNPSGAEERRGFLGGLPGLLLPAPTYTPIPSPTPPWTPTPAPTAAPPAATMTLTAQPEAPRLRLKVNAWCRSGPAVYYEAMAALRVGAEVQALGRYEGERGAYWLVQTPQGTRCWLPQRYATLVEPTDFAALPTVEPPPSPPVAFVVGLERYSQCGQRHGVTLWIRNEGNRVLESADVKIEGPGLRYTFTTRLDHRNGFVWWLNCQTSGRLERLLPGETGYMTIDTNADIQGDIFTVTIKACTENNLQGLCLERRLALP